MLELKFVVEGQASHVIMDSGCYSSVAGAHTSVASPWPAAEVAASNDPVAIDQALAHLQDHLLRSNLVKQLGGANRVDDIIVEEVMTAAEIEANKAALSVVVADEVCYSPITVTTDSSSDLE